MAGPGEPHNLTSPTVAPPRSRKKDPTTWLVCVDGSEISDRAFQQCLNLAGLADTIHVGKKPVSSFGCDVVPAPAAAD